MLRGTSDSLELDQLLELLARNRRTGRLDLRAERCTATLYFGEGLVHGMTGRDAGRYFVAPSGEHQRRWPDTAMDSLANLLSDRRLGFVFDPRWPRPDGTGCATAVDDLLEKARSRMYRWGRIREVLGGPEARPALVVEPDQVGPLQPIQWRVLAQINAVRSVSGLVRRTGMGRLETCEVLADLVRLGLVDLRTDVAAPAGDGCDEDRPDPAEYVRLLDYEPGAEPAPGGSGRGGREAGSEAVIAGIASEGSHPIAV